MNEPAFPNEGFSGWGQPFQGMTLRDYFAARAMTALMEHFLVEKLHLVDNHWMSGVAMDAYAMADAMLKEREE